MKIAESVKAEARAWWVKLDGGSDDPELLAEFQRWLAADAAHREAYRRLQQLWSDLAEVESRLVPASADMPLQPREPVSAKVRQRVRLPLALAASVALYWLSPLSLGLRADFHTGFGEVRDIALSDGSSVHLNGNSALQVQFGNGQRSLTLLRGEALFEVSPDPARPFRVQAGDGVITALGTAFNVRLDGGRVVVGVTEHSVALELQRDGRPQRGVLLEGQQAAFAAEQGIGPVQAVDKLAASAWRRGKLVFEDRPLGEVVAELNRYHRGLLLVGDSALAERRVSGVFATGQPLAVLAALESALHIRSTRLGDYLILLHR
ncbi:FecR family protein [Methylomonas koyamae]|uniref:FecR family protein n=1 Tax=Methylomonas koyamae TaxID=702114 RepID=UPI001C3233A4|nr:FecR family protein [Methylomonas koyamae]BBL60613.1 iron dicitrate transporter FecR [Methylomonas koyamae]